MCLEALQYISSSTQENILDLQLLIYRVASLDTITTLVLIYLIVQLTLLLAILLKEAIDSNTIRVLNITITIGNLYPLELKDSCDIGVNYALSK